MSALCGFCGMEGVHSYKCPGDRTQRGDSTAKTNTAAAQSSGAARSSDTPRTDELSNEFTMSRYIYKANLCADKASAMEDHARHLERELRAAVELMEAAIAAGDWKVDGACDPTAFLDRQKKASGE